MNYFFSEREIRWADKVWYDNTDFDSLCLAENRLARGEKPIKTLVQRVDHIQPIQLKEVANDQ